MRYLIITILLLTGCGFFEVDEGISAAVSAGDPEMCAQLEDEGGTRIDRCYEKVASSLDDPTICSRIDKTRYKDDCYSGIAVSTENGDLCKDVQVIEERNNCYASVSGQTHDTSLCDQIDSLLATQKEDCYTNAAIGKDDVNICQSLPDPSTCISQMARNNRDMSLCDSITDSYARIACQSGVAISTGDCDKIERESSREACKDQQNADSTKSCESEYDCPVEQVCIQSYCITPECTEGAKYCRGDIIEFCDDGRLITQRCIYGCEANDCLTKEEGDKRDREEAIRNGCEEDYSECISEITLKICTDGKKTETKCEFGCKRSKCLEAPKVDLSGTIADMKEKQAFGEVVSGPYMDALDWAIENEKDPGKLAGLEAYQDFLGKSADKYGEAIATLEDLEKLKKIFIDEYDPSMDIENMDASDILAQGLTSKLTDAISNLWPFGGEKSIEQQEQEMAEQQLTVYEAMLERKSENEFLKKSRLDRVGTTMVSIVTDKIASEVKDKAQEMAEAAGGTAFATVGILGDALETVQDEAQNMMFTGLIKAYNRRRAVFEDQYPLKSNEEIHQLTVTDVEDIPYADAKTGVIIAKYGNLLANEDCTTEGNNNPLCVDRHAFWVSMDSSYAHFNDKKMFDRWIAQVKADE